MSSTNHVNEANMPANLAHAIDSLPDDPDELVARFTSLASEAQSTTAPSPTSVSTPSSSKLPHQYHPQAYEMAEPTPNSSQQTNTSTARLNIGQQCPFVTELLPKLHASNEQYFDFIVTPLGAPRSSSSDDHALSFTAPDSLMCATSWSHRVVGSVSDWIRLDDCHPSPQSTTEEGVTTFRPSFQNRLKAEAAFKRELAWAAHLSLPAVLVNPPPAPTPVANLARCINQALLQTQTLQLWVAIPLVHSQPFDLSDPTQVTTTAVDDQLDSWNSWNQIRNLCESHRRLGVALELSADLPPLFDDRELDLTQAPIRPSEEYIISRWLGEPIRAVVVSTEIFVLNKKGFPILSKAHQAVVKHLFDLQNVQWILRDDHGSDTTVDLSSKSQNLGLQPYQYYLRHLFQQHVHATHSQQFVFEAPFRDYLQAPLQPLQDNLESGVYEVFEKDPVKYRLYEDAVKLALKDLFKDEAADTTRVAQVMVVGAGRGPLVRCVLRGAAAVNIKVSVYAIEKNPNAIETLRSLHQSDPAFKDVTIIASDMRNWRGPTGSENNGHGFADLIVSELLGSFGDNELSPECLDGVLHFLKPAGISIPQNSISYLVPISSSKLWLEVDTMDSLKAMETSYVVSMSNYYRMSPVIKPAFKFVHRSTAAGAIQPVAELEGEWNASENPEVFSLERQKLFQQATTTSTAAPTTAAPSPDPSSSTPNNSRHTTLTFPIPLGSTLHGFAGYFTSTLYGSIELSILPGSRFSHGMFSWFPLFFPLKVSQQRVEEHNERFHICW